MDFKFKEAYSINDLLHIVNILRGDNGCPWDKKQTHLSIRQNFIEETYEVIEAIDNNDTELLKEELGDVLLQVVFHSQIESESNTFNFSDVCDTLCKKLIIRHPHIFSDTIADSTEEVLKNWDKIKMRTKNQSSQGEVMIGISSALPALMRSNKVQQKAAKVGFDFEDVQSAIEKIYEETEELKEALKSNDSTTHMNELGDLLFSVVNVARLIGVDSEYALSKSCDKFINRFSKVESILKKENKDINKVPMSELDSLWKEVKNR